MNSESRKFESSDKKIMEIDKALFEKSKILKGLLEDYPGDDDVVPINEVDYENLGYIKDYLKHYQNMEPKEIPKPFPDDADEAFFKSVLNDDWTFNFLKNLGIKGAINLINAANFLQIDGLITILSAYLGWELANCPVEKAREKFKIESDMTEEEKAEFDKYPVD